MDELLKSDLSRELQLLTTGFLDEKSGLRSTDHISDMSMSALVEKACQVSNLLRNSPYLSGRAISERCTIGKQPLGLIYKAIQRSEVCQKSFAASKNHDYFSVVKHYFIKRMYTLVLFVGNTCPSRCFYCPNVTIDESGRRQLASYGKGTISPLDRHVISGVFDDLAAIQKDGTEVLVKISGGLEPLTDMAMVSTIVSCARANNTRVKLFTNGLLLSDPTTRATALQTGDIRISLSTPDEGQYQDICFSDDNDKMEHALANLKKNIEMLVKERDRGRVPCKIGFNSLVLPLNHAKLIDLLAMAEELGVDYVDIKPDYFSNYPPDVVRAMEASTRHAQEAASRGKFGHLSVNFACSLFRDDLFWNDWRGMCDASKQARFKLFVTPFGDCSPVHYGAFPHPISGSGAVFSVGRIGPNGGLLSVLTAPTAIPQIEMKKLNPFELMLNLEIEREEEDLAWGLQKYVNPYHTQDRNTIPPALPREWASSCAQ